VICLFSPLLYVLSASAVVEAVPDQRACRKPSHGLIPEDEVTALCIPAPHTVMMRVQMYAQRQKSALGASHEERVLPFPCEAAEIIR